MELHVIIRGTTLFRSLKNGKCVCDTLSLSNLVPREKALGTGLEFQLFT